MVFFSVKKYQLCGIEVREVFFFSITFHLTNKNWSSGESQPLVYLSLSAILKLSLIMPSLGPTFLIRAPTVALDNSVLINKFICYSVRNGGK